MQLNNIQSKTIKQLQWQNQNQSYFPDQSQLDPKLAERALNQFLKTNVMNILQPLQFQILSKRPQPNKINIFAYQWLRYYHLKQKAVELQDDINTGVQQIIQPDEVFYWRVRQKLKKKNINQYRYGVSGINSGKRVMRFSEQGVLCFDDMNITLGGILMIGFNHTRKNLQNFNSKQNKQFQKQKFNPIILQCNCRSIKQIIDQQQNDLVSIEKMTTIKNIVKKQLSQKKLKTRRKAVQFNLNIQPRVSQDVKSKRTSVKLLVQLRNSILFKDLDEQTIKKMINCMDKKNVRPFDIIYQAGDTLNQFIAISTFQDFQIISQKNNLKNQENQSQKEKQKKQKQKQRNLSVRNFNNSNRTSILQKIDRKLSYFSNLSKKLSINTILENSERNLSCFLNKDKQSQRNSKRSEVSNSCLSKNNSQVSSNNDAVRKADEWQFFGQLALLYQYQAQNTLIYKGNNEGTIWTLHRDDYNFILKYKVQKKLRICCQIFQKAQIFSTITPEQKLKLAQISIQKTFQQGSYVIKEGQIGNCFYLVAKGHLVAQKYEKRSKQVKPVYYYTDGNYFGQIALVRNVPRQASVKALTQCKLIVIQRSAFKRILGPLQKLLRRNQEHYMHIRKQLRRISLQSRLQQAQKAEK